MSSIRTLASAVAFLLLSLTACRSQPTATAPADPNEVVTPFDASGPVRITFVRASP